MKNKKAIIIVIIIGFGLMIGSLIYNKKNISEEWVVCEYQGDLLPSYEETVKFRYAYGRMYGYYENRTITAPDKDNKEEILEAAKEFGKGFEQSEDLKYEVEEVEDLKVKTTFYIKTLKYNDFMKQYFVESSIDENSSIDDVVSKLGSNYKCKITQ